MFELVRKATGEVETVYGINGTYFLLFDKENWRWVYAEMDEFVPKEVWM